MGISSSDESNNEKLAAQHLELIFKSRHYKRNSRHTAALLCLERGKPIECWMQHNPSLRYDFGRTFAMIAVHEGKDIPEWSQHDPSLTDDAGRTIAVQCIEIGRTVEPWMNHDPSVFDDAIEPQGQQIQKSKFMLEEVTSHDKFTSRKPVVADAEPVKKKTSIKDFLRNIFTEGDEDSTATDRSGSSRRQSQPKQSHEDAERASIEKMKQQALSMQQSMQRAPQRVVEQRPVQPTSQPTSQPKKDSSRDSSRGFDQLLEKQNEQHEQLVRDMSDDEGQSGLQPNSQPNPFSTKRSVRIM